MVPAGVGSRWLRCELQGLVLPRSWGAADHLPVLFPAWSQGQTVISFSLLYSISSGYSSVLPLFLKYVSKGFCFSQCCCLQARSWALLPCPCTYPDSVVFYPHVRGLLSHVELCALNTPRWENANTFTAQHEAGLGGLCPTLAKVNGNSPVSQHGTCCFLACIICTSQVFFLLHTMQDNAVLFSCFLLS